MTVIAVLELLVICGLSFALYRTLDGTGALLEGLLRRHDSERQILLDRIQRPERPVGPEPVTMVLPEPEPDEYEMVGRIMDPVDELDLVGTVE